METAPSVKIPNRTSEARERGDSSQRLNGLPESPGSANVGTCSRCLGEEQKALFSCGCRVNPTWDVRPIYNPSEARAAETQWGELLGSIDQTRGAGMETRSPEEESG